MNELLLITCPPADEKDRREIGILEFEPAPDSVRVICDVCKKLCWIGPKQREAIAKNTNHKVLCFKCSLQLRPHPNVRSAGGIGGKYVTNREN